MSKEQSIADKTREFFKTKLDSGYPTPGDKPTANIFVKEAMSTLGLKSGNLTKTKEILKKILDERNVDTSSMGFSKSVGETFHFIKDEVPEPTKLPTEPQTAKTPEIKSNESTTSNAPTNKEDLEKLSPIEKPKEPLPEVFKQRYHRDIGSITKWLHSLSIKHGIREPEPQGQKPELVQLGEDWADYLYESGIKIPKALGLVFLLLRTGVTFVIPVFKFLFKGKKKEEKKPEPKK